MSEEREQYGEQPPADPGSPLGAIPAIVSLGEPEQVQARIRAKYGFTPTAEYCQDLIAFVEEMAREVVL